MTKQEQEDSQCQHASQTQVSQDAMDSPNRNKPRVYRPTWCRHPRTVTLFSNEDKQQSIRTTSCQLPFDSGSLMFTSKSFKFITFLVVLLNRPCPWCCLFLSFFLALSGFLGFILQSSIDCILLPHRPVPAFVLPPQTVHSWPVRSWRLFRRH